MRKYAEIADDVLVIFEEPEQTGVDYALELLQEAHTEADYWHLVALVLETASKRAMARHSAAWQKQVNDQ